MVAGRIGRRVRIYGRVQGVFFRQWTLERARALGLSGWVRNARDGSVEAHLAGEEGAVAEMIEQMRRGPPRADVEGLTADDVEPEAGEGFSVRL